MQYQRIRNIEIRGNVMYDISAESSIIACILLEPATVNTVFSEMRDFDFLDTRNRNIYKTIKQLKQKNLDVDTATLITKMGKEYRDYILNISYELPHISNLKSYMSLAKENSMKKRFFDKINKISNSKEKSSEELREEVKEAMHLLDRRDIEIVDICSGICNFMDTMEMKAEYIKTGIKELDSNVFIEKGDYVVIGGTPSSGKTALTLQMLVNMGKDFKCLYFSFETKPQKIYERIISNQCLIDMKTIKTKRYKNKDKICEELIRFADNNAIKGNIEVVKAAGMTASEIEAVSLERDADVIFIDYMGLISYGYAKSEYEAITNLSKELHVMAQTRNIVIMLISQLNRQEKGETPTMSSVRSSGQIEQDADVMIMIGRSDNKNERTIYVVKNKEGETGKFTLEFDGNYQKFYKTY